MEQVRTVDGTVFRLGDHIGSFVLNLDKSKEIGIVIGFDNVEYRYPTLLVRDGDFRFTWSTLYAHVIEKAPEKVSPSFFD